MSDLLTLLTDRVNTKISLSSIVDLMLANLPATTARTYEQSLRAFASSAGVDPKQYRHVAAEWLQQPDTVRNRAAQGFIDAQAGAGIKPATIQTRLAALRRLLETATFHGVAEGVVVVDRMPRVEHSFKGKDAVPETIRRVRSELAHHPNVARRLRDIAILSLLYPTGIRIGGEFGGRRCGILGLDRGDLDFDTGELRIYLKGRVEAHTIRPDGETMNQLKAWADFRDARLETPAFFVGISRGGELSGERLLQQTFRNDLKKISRKTGGAKCNPHAFRHAVGTQMLRNGFTITQARDQLGHASSRTTERYVSYQDKAAETGERLRQMV